jgi:hypothetical protein
MTRRRFGVLWRAFITQCFVSDTIAAEDQLRATIVGVVAFLLVPGIVMLVELSFDYQGIVLRAIRYQQFDHLTDTIEWVALVFITYSAVAVGVVGAAAWDALVFDRRDAMVLGPLPVSGALVAGAKTAAMASVMLAAAVGVNIVNAFVFAFTTADRLGAAALARHFAAHLTATGGAAVFVFSVLVVLRGAAGLVAGPRVAAALGSLLQFLFVLALFAVVILCPVILRLPHRALVNFTITNALPTSWFLGVFEWIRGSDRWYVPQLAVRAAVATASSLAGAALLSSIAVRHHLRRAIGTPAAGGTGSTARVRRWIARRITAGDPAAGAMADFQLLTLARHRAQQPVLAMNVAVGAALAAAVLAQTPAASLARPGVVVLWIPLALAYWSIVGLRAASFVPAEAASAWIFDVAAPARADARWSAVRAVLVASVLPPIAFIALAVTAFPFGWALALRHALFATAASLVLVEIAAAAIPFVPFTRVYEPGRAKLRTRWWLYVLGTYASAVWPAGIELRTIDRPLAFAGVIAVCTAIAATLEIAGRRGCFTCGRPPIDRTPEEYAGFTVLNIGMAVQGASR